VGIYKDGLKAGGVPAMCSRGIGVESSGGCRHAVLEVFCKQLVDLRGQGAVLLAAAILGLNRVYSRRLRVGLEQAKLARDNSENKAVGS
jgi:hypothetical protein